MMSKAETTAQNPPQAPEPLTAPNKANESSPDSRPAGGGGVANGAGATQTPTAEPPRGLTPADQLRNVAEAMLRFSEVKRTHNGRGRSSTYEGSTDTLAQTGRQLAEMVLAYLAGELEANPDDGTPF